MDYKQFVLGRIQEITDGMCDTNPRYSEAVKSRKRLLEQITPILNIDKEFTLAPCDAMDINDYHEQEFIAAAIEQESLYKQGYWDCVELLKMLGVI